MCCNTCLQTTGEHEQAGKEAASSPEALGWCLVRAGQKCRVSSLGRETPIRGSRQRAGEGCSAPLPELANHPQSVALRSSNTDWSNAYSSGGSLQWLPSFQAQRFNPIAQGRPAVLRPSGQRSGPRRTNSVSWFRRSPRRSCPGGSPHGVHPRRLRGLGRRRVHLASAGPTA